MGYGLFDGNVRRAEFRNGNFLSFHVPADMIDITVPAIGAALGICGAIFNSFRSDQYKLLGFAVWLGSNGLLVYWAYSMQQFEIMVMYCVYFGTATIGIYNHWKPEKKEDKV